MWIVSVRNKMENNILLQSDSYKAGHAVCYDPRIRGIYSYLESRGGKYDNTLFFGLQYYLKKYLEGVRVTRSNIEEACTFWSSHFGRNDYFDKSKWEYVLDKHGGKLPVVIKAVPEGMKVPVGNVLMTMENTDPNCYWITNFLETLLLKTWYPITIATQSNIIRNHVLRFLNHSGDPAGIDFKVHDFGYRGVSSEETAALGSAAHLVSFKGTDTVAGIRLLQKYYGADISIPAEEHSTVCSFGRDGEIQACRHFLEKFPDGIIACVSDTYDIYNSCTNIWGGVLRDKVLARNGTLVIRPDSGDYLEVVPKVLELLSIKFGFTTNTKGFKVLNPHVRVIQGDGMNPDTISELYLHLVSMGWSADNLAVGSGGGLLQKVDRDTQKFAFKCSSASIEEAGGLNGLLCDIDVYKEPITDSGKRSKRGRLSLVKFPDGHYETKQEGHYGDQLKTVFSNGETIKEYTLDEVKKNAGII